MPRAAAVARRDVPTAGLAEKLGEVRARAGEWDAVVVVNEAGVVLGLLRRKELDGDPDQVMEEAMRPGPSTFRPNVPVAEMAHFMSAHGLENSPITTSEGVLVGVLRREDAEAAAGASASQGEG